MTPAEQAEFMRPTLEKYEHESSCYYLERAAVGRRSNRSARDARDAGARDRRVAQRGNPAGDQFRRVQDVSIVTQALSLANSGEDNTLTLTLNNIEIC